MHFFEFKVDSNNRVASIVLYTTPVTSLRSIFRMNLSIFALFFSITVIPFHALNLSCAEPSNPLIIQHLHPLSRISNLLKSLYRTIRMSTSRLTASCNGTQFLQHAPPIRIFVILSPALSLVSQHCKPVTSYIKSMQRLLGHILRTDI